MDRPRRSRLRYLNYAVGAVRFATNNLQSPGLYGSRSKGGNNIAMGWISDGVYLRPNAPEIEKTTAWSTGVGFEHYWSPQWSTSWYGSYGKIELQRHRGEQQPVLQRDHGRRHYHRRHLGAERPGLRSELRLLGGRHAHRLVPGAGSAVCGRRALHADPKRDEGSGPYSPAQGNRPTGVYTARNLGITSVIFRAQRNWGGGD